MKSIKKAAVAVAIILCGTTIQAQEMPKMVVGTSTVKPLEHVQSRKYNGHIVSLESVAVVPQVAGEIKSVHFKEGATVKEGDLLYKIDKVKYEAAAASARATIAQAKASADYASKTFERTKALYEKKVASDDDLDSATSAKAAADAALAASEAALIAAEDDLAHCEITAPISGKIGLNKATAGNYVTTAFGALTTIVRTDLVRLAFSMSARDFDAIYSGEVGLRTGFKVKIILADGSEYPVPAEFEFVDNIANATTDTITLFYTLANTDGKLFAGMSVKVVVAANSPEEVLAVPATAVIHDASGSFVYVLNAEGIPSRREVAVGDATSSYEIVKHGLEIGETIVSRGTHKVSPGVPVTGIPL